MKYLALLLLMSCSIKTVTPFKIKDCIKMVSHHSVSYFVVNDVLEDRYVLNTVFKDGEDIMLNTREHVFSFREVHELTITKKIDCSEVN